MKVTGETFSFHHKRKSAEKERDLDGFIVDKSVRNSKGIVGLGIAVFSRGLCIGGLWPGAINIPIQYGGMPI